MNKKNHGRWKLPVIFFAAFLILCGTALRNTVGDPAATAESVSATAVRNTVESTAIPPDPAPETEEAAEDGGSGWSVDAAETAETDRNGVSFTEKSQEAPQYIVRYKQDFPVPGTQTEVPFDVVDETELESLIQNGSLEWYEEDGYAELLDPVDSGSGTDGSGQEMAYYSAEQWNLKLIAADPAFRNGYLGQGIRVGVVDSGVHAHPALEDRLLEGRDYSAIAAGAEDSKDTDDTYGHGTKVAGLIAGSGEDGRIGAAPGAYIVPLKCTDGKEVKISVLCQAIYGAIDDFDCDVLNLSLGVQSEYQSLREAILYAEEKGVTVVSAAGNGGRTNLYYPAGYDTVIGVGSVDRQGKWYVNSNYNKGVFITAPGAGVRSTDRYNGYTNCSGSSFSVPQVSAAAAVMLSMDPAMTPDRIRGVLSETAADEGETGYDLYYGYGILNIAGCVEELEKKMDVTDPDGFACRFLPDSGTAAMVRNRTGESLSAVYMIVEYSTDGACLGIRSVPLTIPPHTSVEVQTPSGDHSFTQILCDAETMIPLAKSRRIRTVEEEVTS